MSILLQALKKSEEQRRLGETPSIHTPVDTSASSRESLRHWFPMLLISLSFIAMAWFGWQQFQPPDEAGLKTVNDAAAGSGRVESQAESLTESQQGESTPGQAAPGAELQPRTPIEAFTPEPGRPASGEGEAAREAPGEQNIKSELNQSFNEYAAADDAADAAIQKKPAPVKPAPVAGQKSPKRSARPAGTAPITYWELPQGVRDTLPEIKITVLVYAGNSEDRFVLINGQRLTEKQEYQGGLVLDEITREGAVFLYRKYRFLVKG
jgi:general secretion pathway protein B